MFNLQFFLAALPIMLKGMVGIFIVTAIIILCVMALNYCTTKKDSKKKDNE